MRESLGKAQTVRDLLDGVQYTIDYHKFVERSGPPFGPLVRFDRRQLEERGALHLDIAKQIWVPAALLAEVAA